MQKFYFLNVETVSFSVAFEDTWAYLLSPAVLKGEVHDNRIGLKWNGLIDLFSVRSTLADSFKTFQKQNASVRGGVNNICDSVNIFIFFSEKYWNSSYEMLIVKPYLSVFNCSVVEPVRSASFDIFWRPPSYTAIQCCPSWTRNKFWVLACAITSSSTWWSKKNAARPSTSR